ncbi:hypothetical protein SMC1_02645 [Candidatus Cryosericum septentrionale]|uniref:Uncharacterized protein n=1 Tax=Candidatus Cryosericum septentrionale TaxID=2290913 RepID=A0A398DNJ2_9BACT|nr:hypothetical protein SMC1_02645 [Candidatus Cryosericum septentrionale]
MVAHRLLLSYSRSSRLFIRGVLFLLILYYRAQLPLISKQQVPVQIDWVHHETRRASALSICHARPDTAGCILDVFVGVLEEASLTDEDVPCVAEDHL